MEDNTMKKQSAKTVSSLLVIFSLVFSVCLIFIYSYFSYPKLSGGEVGISANTPFFSSVEDSDTININTASKEQLTVLSGIGESKAEAIITYRQENGPFSSIEEIMNVSGIGEKTFENIKSLISV